MEENSVELLINFENANSFRWKILSICRTAPEKWKLKIVFEKVKNACKYDY